jgi:hypothetical protein
MSKSGPGFAMERVLTGRVPICNSPGARREYFGK